MSFSCGALCKEKPSIERVFLLDIDEPNYRIFADAKSALRSTAIPEYISTAIPEYIKKTLGWIGRDLLHHEQLSGVAPLNGG